MAELYIGLMSGTSQDGIDAVLAEFQEGRFRRVIGACTGHYDPALRRTLLELSREATPVGLSTLADQDRRVADAFADTTLALLRQTGVDADAVRAIGSHGQTVFHDARGVQSSLQLGDPSRIAVRAGICVVADFRRADVALGGEGAPLLPAFHHHLFASADEARAVLNLGGIANLTLLPDADTGHVCGYDCGPANCLMDEWAERHRGEPMDRGGAWAAGGTLLEDLLAQLMQEPYFARPAPKSTGRGLFNLAWLEARDADLAARRPQDVQRTLAELTARSVAESLRRSGSEPRRLLVCGGGVHNAFVLARLREQLAGVAVDSTAALGMDPQWIEAAAFAWLAMRRLQGLPGNLPTVTGARRAAVLGGVYLG